MPTLSDAQRALLAGLAAGAATLALYALMIVLLGDGGGLFDSEQPLGWALG